MHKLLAFAITLFLAFGNSGCSSKAGISTANDTFLGHWEGSIGTPGGSLRLFLHVEQDSAGAFKAFIDSPDQLAFQIPVTLIDVRKDTIDLKIVNLMANY